MGAVAGDGPVSIRQSPLPAHDLLEPAPSAKNVTFRYSPMTGQVYKVNKYAAYTGLTPARQCGRDGRRNEVRGRRHYAVAHCTAGEPQHIGRGLPAWLVKTALRQDHGQGGGQAPLVLVARGAWPG